MGFEEEAPAGNLPGWNMPGGSYRGVRDTGRPYAGAASARIEATGETIEGFGTIARVIDATPYRGKRVRLRAAVRTTVTAPGWTGLWMRVDRPGAAGFFDNMQDRPIRSAEWQTYDIEGDVAADATQLVFGLIAVGAGSSWFDEVSVTIVDEAAPTAAPRGLTMRAILSSAGPPRTAAVPGDAPARPVTSHGVANLVALARAYGYAAHFSATDQAAAADWPAIAIRAVEQVEPARDPAALARAINAALRPHAPDFCAYARDKAEACEAPKPAKAVGAIAWRHSGRQIAYDNVYRSERMPQATIAADQILTVDLGGGVWARVPLAAWVGVEGKTLAEAPLAPLASARPEGWVPAGFDRATRLANVIVAWNLFQHFYPYFEVVKADWPALLEQTLKSAATDGDDRAFEATLARLVAALNDGHGRVAYAPRPAGKLPIVWEWVESRLMVIATASGGVDGLRAGDTIERIGDVPAGAAIAERMRYFSGTERWRRWRALDALMAGAIGQPMQLRWSRPGGEGVATLHYGDSFSEPRPTQLAEIGPGILYVDLTRGEVDLSQASVAKLAAAKGIVFDVRGYPHGSPDFLSHLSERPFNSMPMAVPIVTRPDRQGWGWDESSWDLRPKAPRFPGKVVFLTDGRAISYAESILQTVKGNRLGTIVGEPSAGANGNINPTPLPGGYVLIWTGMRVRNLDGSDHHMAGVAPDVTVRRTVAGVRAGRDEVLEKGIALAGE